MPPNSTSSSGRSNDLLDDIFDLLRLANELEEKNRIEAATKYYEAVYLMRRYMDRLPQTEEATMQKELLRERATHYEKRASELMMMMSNDDDATATTIGDNSPGAGATATVAARSSMSSPRSPIDKETFFNEDSSVIPMIPPRQQQQQRRISSTPSCPFSPRSVDVNSRASLANNKLAIALDYDEDKKHRDAVAAYMEAAELFLQAIKLAEEEASTTTITGTPKLQRHQHDLEPVLEVMKRRLNQTLDRVEMLKEVLSGKKTLVPQEKIGDRHLAPNQKGSKLSPSATTKPAGGAHNQQRRQLQQQHQVLTAEEISVLKRSSLIASGLFLPWSDDDAAKLLESALNPKALFKDGPNFLPLNDKQKARFKKWARPNEIVTMRHQSGLTRSPQKVVLIQTITPYTIKQQFVTDCSFIASLCICASFERRFHKRLVTSMLHPQAADDGMPMLNPEGKYMVKLWLNGVARCVVVDDYFPVDKHGNMLCSQTTSSTNSNYLELWVCIIEKAYMKLCGGYDFPGSNSGVDLFSLTGWIPERILFAENPDMVRDHETHPERAWERIFSASAYGDCLITVSTDRGVSAEEIKSTGLVTGHAYAVLSVVETKNGTRLLQLKNPWAHQSWKGRYSSTDLASWGDPSFCAEVGYNPQLAMKRDDGVFWICWKDILHFYQNFHLSWNPLLFSFRLVTHGFWSKDHGPSDDTFNVGENPQYILALSSQAIQRKASVWILISRHVTKQEQEGGEVQAFLTVHIHRNDARKRRIWYPGRSGNCILNGAYTNNPHVLVRYDVTGPDDAFLSLILSQYNKSSDLGYTLSCFCTEPFQLGQPSKDLEHTIELASAWTPGKCGGPLGTRAAWEENPTFALSVPASSSSATYLQIRVSTSKTSAVHVLLVPVPKHGDSVRKATGEAVIDTGKYRHGFVVTDRTRVPAPGSYALLITNFHAGELSSFRLVVASSTKIRVDEIL